jgi:hypothetical protein
MYPLSNVYTLYNVHNLSYVYARSVMYILSVMCTPLPPPSAGNASSESDLEAPHSWATVLSSFWVDVKQVLEQKVWLLSCMGYTLYVAVLGVYAYW